MSAGESKDYKFGTKNNWRRRVWNEIRQRVSVSSRDALVLYLAGAQDLDRPVAISKGFAPHNLIAVDKSKRVVDALRGRGSLAIRGDFLSVLESWPAHVPVHVVIGDFCSGLEKSLWRRLTILWCNPALACAVSALNFQHGREHTAQDWRDRIELAFDVSQRGIESGHRGVQFICGVIVGVFVPKHPSIAPLLRKPIVGWTQDDGDLYERVCRELLDRFLNFTRPLFVDPYRSGRALYFDTVILNGFARTQNYRPSADQITKFKQYGDLDLRRQIAAVLAHRTRRLNGCAKIA